jgi:hypothetical protein
MINNIEKAPARGPVARFDPSRLPTAPRHFLGELEPEARALLGGVILEFLQSRPGTQRPGIRQAAYDCWSAIRTIEWEARGGTFEALLSRVSPSPTITIAKVIEVLVSAGDLRATLVAERARLDETLAQLDALAEIAK